MLPRWNISPYMVFHQSARQEFGVSFVLHLLQRATRDTVYAEQQKNVHNNFCLRRTCGLMSSNSRMSCRGIVTLQPERMRSTCNIMPKVLSAVKWSQAKHGDWMWRNSGKASLCRLFHSLLAQPVTQKQVRTCKNMIKKALAGLLFPPITKFHDDVIEWKYFPRYCPFVRGIHRSPVNSPHKGQWRGALMFSLVCALNKRLSKHSWGWWFETPSRPLWSHCNAMSIIYVKCSVSLFHWDEHIYSYELFFAIC